MGSLAQDVLRFILIGGDFSWLIWLGVTVSLIALAAVLSTIAPRLVDPIAIEIAVRPARIATWIPLSFLMWGLLSMILFISIIAAPLIVIVFLGATAAAVIGLIALSMIVGDRVSYRYLHKTIAPWKAAVIGMALARLIRAIPYVGAFVFGLIMLVALAAASALIWDKSLSWHRRRLPDDVQFAGENLIEWDEVSGKQTPTPGEQALAPAQHDLRWQVSETDDDVLPVIPTQPVQQDPRFAWRQRP